MFKLFNSYIGQNLPSARRYLNKQHTAHNITHNRHKQLYYCGKGVQLGVRLGLALLVQGHARGHDLDKKGAGVYTARVASIILLAGQAFFWGGKRE
jgi:hypothetical protein